MSVQTIEQIQRLPPYLEGLQKRLLQSLYGTFDGQTQTTPGLLDKPIDLPDFQIAGMDPLQQMALSYAPQMFGSFQPYMQGAQAQIGSGLGTLGAASTGIGAGLGQLADPSESVKRFFDPFQEQVIQQAEKDIERDADLRSQKLLSGLQGQGQGIGSGQAIDLKYVESSSREIAKYAKGHTIVVEKSTLPVKTAQTIKEILDAAVPMADLIIVDEAHRVSPNGHSYKRVIDLFLESGKSDAQFIGLTASPERRTADQRDQLNLAFDAIIDCVACAVSLSCICSGSI